MKMCDNLQNCCRLCLDINSEHVLILGDPTINMHLKTCLSNLTMSPNDHLPKFICVSCVSQLSQFYNFQLNARCAQDWLESSMQETIKKTSEPRTVQPLPDSEYNSDSLLEFLNNAAVEEYLNNLGKEDIPSIVNMLDKNEQCFEFGKALNLKSTKNLSPKKKEKNYKMEIDVLDSDVEIVKEIIMKKTDTKSKLKVDKNTPTCFGCKSRFDNIQKLSQHISICDNALRTCIHCHILFDSKQKVLQHLLTHNPPLPVTCSCGILLQTKEKWIQHSKICPTDQLTMMGCVYRCKECKDTFKDRFLLYKHAKEHLVKAQQRICDICGHRFLGNDALSKHMKDQHKEPENLLYRCKVCNETSSDRKQMYLHVKKHTEKRKHVNHLCESCGNSFTSRASLMRHVQLHDQNRNRCKICNAQFASEQELDAHISEHNMPMIMCEKCGQTVLDCKLPGHKCI